jgi:hypothetical protein
VKAGIAGLYSDVTAVGLDAAVQVFLSGAPLPLVMSADPVAGPIIVVAGCFQSSATQLRWIQNMPASLLVGSATEVYTIAVTTAGGTGNPFGIN